VDSHEAAITLIIAKAAELVGVRPATRNPTSVASGMMKCQPSFNIVGCDDCEIGDLGVACQHERPCAHHRWHQSSAG